MADDHPSETARPATSRTADSLLAGLREHRVYRLAIGYAVGAWLVLQVAAIVLPGFAAPPWVLRGLMIVLALGFGGALLVGWGYDRRAAGRSLLPRASAGRLAWVLTALLPAATVTAFFLLHPPSSPTASLRAPAAAASPAVSGVQDKSIAVLPFENLSADKDNAFFADGVQDEVLTDLARVADLKVISRTSVMQFRSGLTRNLREIGQQLGVAHILEGSVQRAGNKIRVTAQLIDARTDIHLWAEHYDRPLDDVFAIQSEIAEAIAGELRAVISPQEKHAIDAHPTADMMAYSLYLRAQTLYGDVSVVGHANEKLSETVQLLEEALRRDSKFLLAWCLLARVHCYAYFEGVDHTPTRLEQAHAVLQRALALQPDAGEVHLALADYYYHGFRDYEHALAELTSAQRTLPNAAQVHEYRGYISRRQGRWPECARALERALELDPRNMLILQQLALTYQLLHRFDDEAHIYDRALTVVPGDPNTRINRAIVDLEERGDIKPYVTTLNILLAENPRVGPDVDDPIYALCQRTPLAAARTLASFPPEGAATLGGLYPRAYWQGVVARWQGDAPGARMAFITARGEVEKVVAAQPELAIAVSLLGIIDAGLGRKAEAIAEGQRACMLLPVSKDAFDGAAMTVNLAQILAWSGEKDAAVEQLVATEEVPAGPSYGLLKLHPIWDDLRGEEQFQALVTSLAPKPGP